MWRCVRHRARSTSPGVMDESVPPDHRAWGAGSAFSWGRSHAHCHWFWRIRSRLRAWLSLRVLELLTQPRANLRFGWTGDQTRAARLLRARRYSWPFFIFKKTVNPQKFRRRIHLRLFRKTTPKDSVHPRSLHDADGLRLCEIAVRGCPQWSRISDHVGC
jgi:hypothetical protein